MFLGFNILVAWPLFSFNLELSKNIKKLQQIKQKRYVVKEKSFLLTLLSFFQNEGIIFLWRQSMDLNFLKVVLCVNWSIISSLILKITTVKYIAIKTAVGINH